MFGQHTLYVGLSYGAAVLSVLWLCVHIRSQRKRVYQFLKNAL